MPTAYVNAHAFEIEGKKHWIIVTHIRKIHLKYFDEDFEDFMFVFGKLYERNPKCVHFMGDFNSLSKRKILQLPSTHTDI